jgi:hypothetical protein
MTAYTVLSAAMQSITVGEATLMVMIMVLLVRRK